MAALPDLLYSTHSLTYCGGTHLTYCGGTHLTDCGGTPLQVELDDFEQSYCFLSYGITRTAADNQGTAQGDPESSGVALLRCAASPGRVAPSPRTLTLTLALTLALALALHQP